MTMNSPESLLVLHRMASKDGNEEAAVSNAELMREVGLKCIGFNGVRELQPVDRQSPCMYQRHNSGTKND